MTLAMADHQPSPVESFALVATNGSSESDNSPAPATSSPPVTPSPEKEMAAEISRNTRLEKTANPGPGEPLQLVHKNLSASSRSNVAFSVQAGYGRIWDEKSMLQTISAGHQETGCAFVAANFSF